MKTSVSVTRRHLNQGRSCILDRCAIALAIKSRVKRSVSVRVSPDYFKPYVTFETFRGGSVNKRLPARAAQKARRFDNAYEVNPFTFRLDIPKEMLKPHA